MIEPRIGLREGVGHIQRVQPGERLAALQRLERRPEQPVDLRPQRIGDLKTIARGLKPALLEMPCRVRPKFARTMVRQILEDTPVNLAQVGDIELASDRVQGQ
ncbi:hypothetical protein V8201_16265 [Sphingomonas kyungheensis]|uniref:Uncharacterized protein n=1 Tax=Sphingomonas kyungheensis TaxID=1069987 RepID=A0ABU8H6Q1_9SPHN